MEFVEGLLNLCLLDMPISNLQNLKLLKIIHQQMDRIVELLDGQQLVEWKEDAVGI